MSSDFNISHDCGFEKARALYKKYRNLFLSYPNARAVSVQEQRGVYVIVITMARLNSQSQPPSMCGDVPIMVEIAA